LTSAGNANVPLSSSATVGAVTHVPGVAEHATVAFTSPAAAASASTAPVTLEGPLLVTVIV